jgi:predicted Rossmann fold nucleotide-binding protein DprA/Smf involved in DNA uptake
LGASAEYSAILLAHRFLAMIEAHGLDRPVRTKRVPGRQEDANTPLTLPEYNQLAQWLHERAMRPADLLDEGWQGKARNSGFPLSIGRVEAHLRRGAAMAFAVESWTSKGLWVVSRSDDSYPHLLKSRLGRQAPPILYGAGEIALTSQGGLAIVGSRHTDDETLAFVRRVAQACASQGVQIVSGGARGVGSEAMIAALDSGGTAVGVLADSLAKQAVSSPWLPSSSVGGYRGPRSHACLLHVG